MGGNRSSRALTEQNREIGARPITHGRHENRCTVCAHPQREEIEQAFINWTSSARIAKRYGVCRDAIYRHARAAGLVEKRRCNVRAALERIIEHAGEVKVNAPAVVQAVATYARINARGEWVERRETVNLNDLFERMSTTELEAYAQDGTLPAWFDAKLTATGSETSGGRDHG